MWYHSRHGRCLEVLCHGRFGEDAGWISGFSHRQWVTEASLGRICDDRGRLSPLREPSAFDKLPHSEDKESVDDAAAELESFSCRLSIEVQGRVEMVRFDGIMFIVVVTRIRESLGSRKSRDCFSNDLYV